MVFFYVGDVSDMFKILRCAVALANRSIFTATRKGEARPRVNGSRWPGISSVFARKVFPTFTCSTKQLREHYEKYRPECDMSGAVHRAYDFPFRHGSLSHTSRKVTR